MNPLETHLFERLQTAMRQIPLQEAREIYAFYLVMSLDESGAYRPSLSSLAWLTYFDVTPEKARNYGSKWSGWAASGETILTLCNDTHDASGFTLQNVFYESLLSDERAQKKWETFKWLWPFRWDEEELAPRRIELDTRLDALQILDSQRHYASSMMDALTPFDLNAAFFPILENVIRQLHHSGVVREVYGQDVPIGVMATNDVGYEWGLESTRRANPAGISRGMEEWMMGESYAAIEAREKLECEIAALPREEQAAFWVRCAIEINLFFWNDQHSPLTDDLRARGLLHKTTESHVQHVHTQNRLKELLPEAAPLLIEEIARKASNGTQNYGVGPREPHDLASHLLSILESLGAHDSRDAIPETAIEQLREVQKKLWHDAQNREKIGSCLQYTFRVLHRLRPDRFPTPKHDRREHNRIINASDFGL